MKHTIKVRVKGQEEAVIAAGTRVSDLLPSVNEDGLPLLGAIVNNMVVPLFSPLVIDAQIEPLTIRDSLGWSIYQVSLCFLLAKVAHELFPGVECRIRNTVGSGLYCTLGWDNGQTEVEIEAKLKQLKESMQAVVRQDLPIVLEHLSYEATINLFSKTGQSDKLNLLAHRNPPLVCLFRCGSYYHLGQRTLVARTGVLDLFDIIPLAKGFVLNMPTSAKPRELSPLPPVKHLFNVYHEHIEWGKIIGITTVGELNQAVLENRAEEFIQTIEALHAKKLGSIADEITNRTPVPHLVLVAGPSSAGKTTFSKRLMSHLRVNGFKPILLSTDNYFVGDELNPRDEAGNLDYEHIEAMDLKRLNSDLLQLLAGEPVHLRHFNFITRSGYDAAKATILPNNGIVVMEGIHCLNPKLTSDIARQNKYLIYINALTQLGLDSGNRISTTDTRIIRRMVRDAQFRKRQAIETLQMWESIERGERRWIYPFQHLADQVFNSALDYELAILKPLAVPLLNQIKPWDREYIEARRLSGFLHNFSSMTPDVVPGDSILREYIGNSQLRY